MSHWNTHSGILPKQIKLRTRRQRKLHPQSSHKAGTFQTLCMFCCLTNIWQIQRFFFRQNVVFSYFPTVKLKTLWYKGCCHPNNTGQGTPPSSAGKYVPLHTHGSKRLRSPQGIIDSFRIMESLGLEKSSRSLSPTIDLALISPHLNHAPKSHVHIF